MKKNTVFKTLTAVFLSAVFTYAHILPVAAHDKPQPIIKARNNRSGIEMSEDTVTIHSGTYSSADLDDLAGKEAIIDGDVVLTDPLRISGTDFTIVQGAELTVPFLTVKDNSDHFHIYGKLTLTQSGSTIDNSTIYIEGINSLLQAVPGGHSPLIELVNDGTINIDAGNIDLIATTTAVCGDGLVMISNGPYTYASFKGSGPVIDLPADHFMVEGGSVYIEGAQAPTYDQYVQGNTHPGLTHSIVNGMGDPLSLFVVEEGQLPNTIEVEGDSGSYPYSFGYRNGNAYIWVPAATIEYAGASGAVNGTALTSQGISQKDLLIRGSSFKQLGFALPQAADPNLKFDGWKTSDGTAADGNTILHYETNTLTAQYAATVNIEYVCDGKSVGEKPFAIRSDNMTVPAAEIRQNMPTGYGPVVQVQDHTFTKDGETQTIQVRPADALQDHELSIQYVNGSDVIHAYDLSVPSDQTVVPAEDIRKHVPEGYKLAKKARDMKFTADQSILKINVESVVQDWNIAIHYVDGNNIISTCDISVPSDHAVVPAEDIEKNVPSGYALVSRAHDLTASSDRSIQIIEVQKVDTPAPGTHTWTVELIFKDRTSHASVSYAHANVPANDPVLTASQTRSAMPEGYMPATKLQDTPLQKSLFKDGRTDVVFLVERRAATVTGTNTSAAVHADTWVRLSIGAAAAGILVYASKQRKN